MIFGSKEPKKTPHRKLTVEQSAQLKRMIDEARVVTERAAAALHHCIEPVGGSRDIITNQISNLVYEICPDAMGEIPGLLREIAVMYDDMMRYCNVEPAVKAWAPDAPNK